MLPIVDADGHLDEVPTEIVEYFDPPLKGHRTLALAHGMFPSWPSFKKRARSFINGSSYSPYRDDPTPELWLSFADTAGIEQAVLYPTAGLFFGHLDDPEVAVYLARAYNNWVHARYMQASPRFHTVALLPWQSVPAAVAELKRVHDELGINAVLLHALELDRPGGDSSYWPVYEAAQALGVFIGVHSGSPHRNGLGELGVGMPEFMRGIVNHPVGLMVELTSMVMQGVFERFPELKVGYLEAGCGWVPFMMDRLDDRWGDRGAARRYLGKRPSDCLRDSPIYFSAEPYERSIPSVIDALGVEHLFFASDFPHEADEEDRIEHLEAMRALSTVSPEQRQLILHDNALQAYSLTPVAMTAGTRPG
jgi:predicted TIM-barrel fold metal-dependent hydrolase